MAYPSFHFYSLSIARIYIKTNLKNISRDEEIKNEGIERNTYTKNDEIRQINTMPERKIIDSDQKISPTRNYEKRLFVNRSLDVRAKNVR